MSDMAVQGLEPSGGAAFEDIRAMFRESALRHKEIDQLLQEIARQQRETDRKMKETDRKMKETDRKIGKLGSRLGDVIENLMSPKLHKKFRELNLLFNRSSRNVEIRDHDQKHLAEVDVLLENGEFALAVEVKTHLTSKDVKDHIKRMEILRRVADEHNDRRKYLGAVAGAVVTPEVSAYALKNGFYVIIPSGETVDIEAPDGFHPRIWGPAGPERS
jgi:predicted AAA+ superfamily ATPase